MLPATFLEGLFLDLLSHRLDLRAPTVIDVGGRQVAQALVIALVVVVIDECADLAFKELAHQIVIRLEDRDDRVFFRRADSRPSAMRAVLTRRTRQRSCLPCIRADFRTLSARGYH